MTSAVKPLIDVFDGEKPSLSGLPSSTAFGDIKFDLSSFASFLETFPLQGEQLYSSVFERNGDIVQTQKAKFAVANLEKILTTTFEISSVSGFDRMSLRDLSRETKMSMGAIYSCIGKKEDIALMIADIVRLSSELTQQHAERVDGVWSRMEQSIRFHLYASTLLQHWYFFLYFETRSLPPAQQLESKQIELDGIQSFEALIAEGVRAGDFHTSHPKMVANTIVVLLEDWYLKPWKTQMLGRAQQSLAEQEEKLNNYNQSILELVEKLLAKR